MTKILPNDLHQFKLTYTLITLNIAVYLLVALLSGNFVDIPPQSLFEYGGVYGPSVLQEGEWYRIGASLFLHGGMTHLLMNMVSLYLVGRAIEHLFSTSGYLLIYFASGIIGALLSLHFHPMSVNIGASGAIFGVFGALVGFFILFKDRFRSQSKAFFKDMAVILGINLFIGVAIPSVDISAHIGGLAIGTIGGLLLGRKGSGVWLFIALVVVAIALLYGVLIDEYTSIV